MDALFTYLATGMTGAVAYGVIFAILIACGLGFPLPEDIPLAAAGYLVWSGVFSVEGALLVTIVGVVVGDSMLFLVGRKLGARLLDPNRKKPFFPPKRVRRVKAYFRKYGDKIVFFARFVAGFRAVVFFVAGAIGMPYRRFVWFDTLAALLSVPLWLSIGYGLGHYLGDQIDRILKEIHHFKGILTLIIAVLVVAFLIRIGYKYIQMRRLRARSS